MNTIKTTLVVVALLAIGYGVYVTLNRSPLRESDELSMSERWDSSGVEVSIPGNPVLPDSTDTHAAAGDTAAPFLPPVQPGAPGSGEMVGHAHSPAGSDMRSSERGWDSAGDRSNDGSGARGANPGSDPQATTRYADPSYPTPIPTGRDYGSGDTRPYETGRNDAQPYGSGTSAATSPAGGSSDRYDRAAPDYSPSSAPGGQDATQRGGSTTFSAAWESAQSDLNKGQLSAALFTLSVWYDSSDLTQGQRGQVTELLDKLAGSVIFSRQHTLQPPYRVNPGETLDEIAGRHDVPWRLLAKINGIDDPRALEPGKTLKVLRGPFTAMVSLSRRELTLFLDKSYAGRFPISIGSDRPPQEGVFQVRDKMVERTHYDRTGREIPPGNPDNPYGKFWLGLGGKYDRGVASDLGIHAAAVWNGPGGPPGRGCIGLNPRDAEDLYDILSLGSTVIIKR